jgi:hypothetical protein
MGMPYSSQRPTESSTETWRGSFTSAGRFWEPRRIVYNLLLAAIVVIWLLATWPHFRAAMTLPSFLPLAVLALLANVCYSAAYLLDVPMQRSGFSAIWDRKRWIIWSLGTLFAILVENYWIVDEIYPSVR